MSRNFMLLAILAFLLPGRYAVAQNIFVKILDQNGNLIEGESIDNRHANEIDALSFGQENTSCASNTGGGGGQTTCSGKAGHFIFNMNANKSLPLLDKALFSGASMRSVDIVFRKGGANPTEYYKIHLETVLVTHVTNSGDTPAPPIAIQVELDAAKMGWTYIPQKADGSAGTPVKFGWDVTKNSEWTAF